MQLDDIVSMLQQQSTKQLKSGIEETAKSQSILVRELKRMSHLDRDEQQKALQTRIRQTHRKESKYTEKEVKKVVADFHHELKRFVFK